MKGMALEPCCEEFCMLSKWEKTEWLGEQRQGDTKADSVRKPVWQKHKLYGRHVLAKVEEDKLENLQ